MGLLVSIYRSDRIGDCTLNGISGHERGAEGLCLVNVEGPFKPSADYPAAMLVDWRPFGDEIGRRSVKVVPAVELNGTGSGRWATKPGWSMFGGNYAACSDSRFGEAVRRSLGVDFYGAVAIHDRFEA